MHLKELKDHWETLREEVDQLPGDYIQEEPRVYGDWLKSDGISHILTKYMLGNHGWIKGWQDGWEQWPIIWDSQIVESNAKFSPKTMELLKSISNIKVAAFALMKGGVKLKEHTDPVGPDYKFTYHLGLKCPEGCYLHHRTLGDVEEEDGKHIVMNARFPHWAENTSQEDRVILYIEYYTSTTFR
jgi:hypothetical protein